MQPTKQKGKNMGDENRSDALDVGKAVNLRLAKGEEVNGDVVSLKDIGASKVTDFIVEIKPRDDSPTRGYLGSNIVSVGEFETGKSGS